MGLRSLELVRALTRVCAWPRRRAFCGLRGQPLSLPYDPQHQDKIFSQNKNTLS